MPEKRIAVKKSHKNIIKIIINVIFFLVVTCLALYYVLKDDPSAIISALGQVHFFPFLLAIAAVIVMDVCDGLSLTLLAKLFDKRYRFSQGLINSIIGNFIGCFYKTGASFLQAYTFTKQGVKGTNAASICTMNFLIYQFTVTFFSLIMVFVGYPYVKDIPIELFGGIKIFPLSLIGFGINVFFLVSILLMAYWRGLHHFVINTGVSIGYRLHLVKDKDETRKRWAIQFATYRIELKRLMKHGWLVLLLILIQAIKLILLNTIPYLCFFSLGLDMSKISYVACLSGSVYLNLISSYLVFGAPEVGFQSIFAYLLSAFGDQAATYASAGNLLWRTLTFYLSLIVGGLCFLFYKGSPRRQRLLSTTATMYDLQVMNLDESGDDATKRYISDLDQSPLLSEADLDESFKRIKQLMNHDDAKESENDPAPLDEERLNEHKKELVRVIEETEELMKVIDSEHKIEEEAMTELASAADSAKQKKTAKLIRKEKRMQRKAEKIREKIAKKNPEGSVVTYDEETGLDIRSPESYECQTYTTSVDTIQDRDEGREI